MCGGKKTKKQKQSKVKEVIVQINLVLFWQVSKVELIQPHYLVTAPVKLSENRSVSYCETEAAGRGRWIWVAGPPHFFGLSLRRGSNLRYKDCFLNADSLNWGQKEWKHLTAFRSRRRKVETLCEVREDRTYTARTKLLKVVNLSIKVIGHDCRGKVNRLIWGEELRQNIHTKKRFGREW